MFQGSDAFQNKNIRIVPNDPRISYWGVTHEYVNLPQDVKTMIMPYARILDIGDGGSKSDKADRDIRLLEQGLQDEPNSPRYLFYLANSYFDKGDYEKAIDTYRKRIAAGGWIEEKWYSWYRIGQCYKRLRRFEESIDAFLQAVEYVPDRIENIYEVVKLYRETGKHKLAVTFYNVAKQMKSTQQMQQQMQQMQDMQNIDHLFLHKDVYTHLLDYEFSVAGYYWNPDHVDMLRFCMDLLQKEGIVKNAVLCKNVLSNYKFYAKRLEGHHVNPIQPDIDNAASSLTSSTPSIVLHNGSIIVNVRHVNYRIDDLTGNYINWSQIITENVLHLLPNTSSKIVDTFNTEIEPHSPAKGFPIQVNPYVGLEDLRLLSHNGQLLYTGNRGLGRGHMAVELGSIVIQDGTVELRDSIVLQHPNGRPVEKNWSCFSTGDTLSFIYEWYPLTIGHIDGSTFVGDTTDATVPAFFKHLRGTSHGVYIPVQGTEEQGKKEQKEEKQEIWFLCHLVNYESRRHYYHLFVILDPVTKAYKRHSMLFTFTGANVEYSGGFIYNADTHSLTIGYSVMDRSTNFIEVPLDAIPMI